MNKQSQKGGDNSTNIQGEKVTIVTGLSLSEVKETALDVFKTNFQSLAGTAKQIAEERAGKITEAFFEKLRKENPEGFRKAEDPDFQYGLFTVQKEYARNGDSDLGDLLVDLLVDRSKHKQRDILQIVLNESLAVAPKVTNDQMDALSIVFLFKYSQNLGLRTHELLGKYLDKYIKRVSGKLPTNHACYQHLEFSGCGSIVMGTVSLERCIGSTYQGLFLKGFDLEEVTKKNFSVDIKVDFLTPCLNNKSKLQVKALNVEDLDRMMDKHGILGEDRKKLKKLFDLNKMRDAEIREKCISIRSYMEKVFDAWADSSMKQFTLTSVGIAIGHANIKRFVGEFSNLSIWIN